LREIAKPGVITSHEREVIFGARIMGAKIRAEHASETTKGQRDADRAEAELWSLRLQAYGGPAQPSPTIGQCLNGGLGWPEVECNPCKARASLPLDAIRRPRDNVAAHQSELASGTRIDTGCHHLHLPDAGDRSVSAEVGFDF
jgi:hypothetical protein